MEDEVLLKFALQAPLSQQLISLWGAPQQTQLLDQRYALIIHGLRKDESHVLGGTQAH